MPEVNKLQAMIDRMGLKLVPIDYHKLIRSNEPCLNYDYYDEIVTVGTVLKMDDGQLILIGDTNRLLGVCDDCVNYEPEQIMEYVHLFDWVEDET